MDPVNLAFGIKAVRRSGGSANSASDLCSQVTATKTADTCLPTGGNTRTQTSTNVGTEFNPQTTFVKKKVPAEPPVPSASQGKKPGSSGKLDRRRSLMDFAEVDRCAQHRLEYPNEQGCVDIKEHALRGRQAAVTVPRVGMIRNGYQDVAWA